MTSHPATEPWGESTGGSDHRHFWLVWGPTASAPRTGRNGVPTGRPWPGAGRLVRPVRRHPARCTPECFAGERVRALLPATAQQPVLELIAAGAAVTEILTMLALVVEAQIEPGQVCSILLLGPDRRHLYHGAAPSLPESFTRAVDGLEIGPAVGSCGTAAFSGLPILAADIATDSRWAGPPSQLALAHGLRACWSSPILDRAGVVLGTFAIYHHRPWRPGPRTKRLVDAATYLARIAIERERTEQALHEAERAANRVEGLRVAGLLAGGVAHDLNQALSLVMGSGDLLATLLANPSVDLVAIREAANQMVGGSLQAGETVKRLLAIIRPAPDTAPELVDLAALLREVAHMTAPQWARRHTAPIRLDVRTGSEPLHITGWPGPLRSALMNLVFNAIDALPRGGAIQLTARAVNRDAEILVADTGLGMPAEVRARAFEPFFTTKGDRGTGLGLSQVHAIVERHGGSIAVESTPGQGTVFRLAFPLNGAATSEDPRAPVRAHSRGATTGRPIVQSGPCAEPKPASLSCR